ncbi:MAG TPA: VOC family protein [Thermoanaerobaculia bacterium]|nr:VOC family protein [Thermoanaerobaculia bacterium]
MQILAIDHINIAGPRELLQRCRDFYIDVLGLTEGHRPPFRSRGFWLYAGGHPIVHLSEVAEAPARATGAFNHFALQCEGLEQAKARLAELGLPYEVNEVPLTSSVQLFVTDPAGVGLELNFRTG